MADPKKRLDTNVAGNFFVDATCINCDTCRQLAPGSFEEVGEFSSVTTQPEGNELERFLAALRGHRGNVSQAARAAGISRMRAYRLMNAHPEVEVAAFRRAAEQDA